MLSINTQNINISAPHSLGTVAINQNQEFLQFLLGETAQTEPVKPTTTSEAVPPQSRASAAMIGGAYFDDKIFAKDIGHRSNDSLIDTKKTLNWAATGSHSLTDAEIADLKQKYDITNLSPQDYYDIMADLTNLNAISSTDAVSKFWRKADWRDFQGMMFLEGHWTDNANYLDDSLSENGNMIRIFQKGIQYYKDGLSYFQASNGSFKKYNARLLANDPKLQLDLIQSYSEHLQFTQRMLALFQSLQREDTKISA